MKSGWQKYKTSDKKLLYVKKIMDKRWTKTWKSKNQKL